MVRRPRVEFEGAVYHVYNRVASGERLFDDPEEARNFTDLLREVKERDGWTVQGRGRGNGLTFTQTNLWRRRANVWRLT